MNDDNLDFDTRGDVPSVTDLLKQFPHLPPKVLVTLAVLSLMARSVTPFRLCACGCGESVHGKARLASPACRQRVSRASRAVRATAPSNFNLVLQDEIPVPIPFSPAPRDQGSEIFKNDHAGAVWSAGEHWFIRMADGSAQQVSGAATRRDHGSAQFVVCWLSGHTPPKTLYYQDTSEGSIFGWKSTDKKALAKRFESKESALKAWRAIHQWPEDYEHCLTDGTTWVEEADRPAPEISEPVRWMEVAQAGRLSPADCARNWIQNNGGLEAAIAHAMECQASNARVGLFENAASYDSLIVCMDAMRRGLIPLVKPATRPATVPELFESDDGECTCGACAQCCER